MKKDFQFKKNYNTNPSEVGNQPQILKETRNVRSNLGSGIVMSQTIELKIRNTFGKGELIADLHNIIHPLVVSTRGQCGLVEPTLAWTCKQVERPRRFSHRKCSVGIITVSRDLGRNRSPLKEKVKLLGEADVFNYFQFDLVNMINDRGLSSLDVLNGVVMKDETPRFWLAYEAPTQKNDRPAKQYQSLENLHNIHHSPLNISISSKSFKGKIIRTCHITVCDPDLVHST
eukprot:TRINITY_DN6374_c0_g1_i1.p1 TRINITY_DN6374_c0_g1~~TRINITY_DN6374_c0_g1_i1.p1  ORF type:complete len:230 (+),score=18.93 TRINITY_DN6374_c0_g1_i1:39-728(+)